MNEINWWNIVSKISMEVGGILMLNGLLMNIMKNNRFIQNITIEFSKTKVIIPIFCIIISSLSISIVVGGIRLIKRLF